MEPLNKEPDYDDPKVLAHKLDGLAEGLYQQANNEGTAYGGIPNPSFFYGECSRFMKLAREWILAHAPAESTPTEPPKSPAPPSKGK